MHEIEFGMPENMLLKISGIFRFLQYLSVINKHGTEGIVSLPACTDRQLVASSHVIFVIHISDLFNDRRSLFAHRPFPLLVEAEFSVLYLRFGVARTGPYLSGRIHVLVVEMQIMFLIHRANEEPLHNASA